MRLADFAFALTMLLALPLAEGAIAKSAAWKYIVHQLETGTISLVRWRANANVRNEVGAISRYLGLGALAALVLLIGARIVGSRLAAVAMSWIFAAAFLGWFSFQWTLEHRKYIWDYMKFALLLTALPWLFLLIQFATHNVPLVEIAALPLRAAGLTWSSPLGGAATLSAFFAIGFTALWLIGWVLYAPIPIVILAALWGTNRIAVFASRYVTRRYLFDAVIFLWLGASVYVYVAGRTP